MLLSLDFKLTRIRVRLWGLTLILIYGVGCEWKPPRRPKTEDQTVATLQDATADLQDAIATSQDATATLKDAGLTVADSEMKTRNDIPILTRPDQSTLSVDGTPTEITQSIPKTPLTLSEKLKRKDSLLTIDPEGPALIHIKELIMAESVSRRRPVGASNIFKSDMKQVLAFLRVRNFERPQKIQLKWIYDDQVIQRDRLSVGISPRWRTWSTMLLRKVRRKYGEWRLEVETVRGEKKLGVIHFVIQNPKGTR